VSVKKRAAVFFWQLIEKLPIAIPVFFAIFGTLLIGLLLLHKFENGLIGVSATISLFVTLLVAHNFRTKRPGSNREKRIVDLLALTGIVSWIFINSFFVSQNVFITRDPGVYAVTGKWLTANSSTNIGVDKIIEVPGITYQSNGIWEDVAVEKANYLQPQGMHLFPAFLGVAGKIGGDGLLFKANVFFGGAALMAIYSFARMFMKPRWAALSIMTLAASLPFIYFSRDAYTEMVATMLIFGSLAIVWAAGMQKQEMRGYLLWLIGGVVAGAAFLARADALLLVAAILIYSAARTALSLGTQKKNELLRLSLFLIGAGIPVYLGWLDMSLLTSAYYKEHGDEVILQLLLIGVILVIGVGTAFLDWRSKYLAVKPSHIKFYSYLVVGAIALLALVFASRPLWLKSTYDEPSHGIGHVNALQEELGYPLEPRSYAEHTVDWVRWYIGSPLIVLGVVGLSIAVGGIIKRDKTLLAPAAILTLMALAIYLSNPRITPDQIWAIRRFIPVILPGLVIFGFYALQKIANLNIGLARYAHGFFFVVLSAFLILQPLLTSRPFLGVTENRGHLQSIYQFCQALPLNAYVIWPAELLSLDTVQTTRTYCGKESLGFDPRIPEYRKSPQLKKDMLAQIANKIRNGGYEPVFAIHGSQREELSKYFMVQTESITSHTSNRLQSTLLSPPRQVVSIEDTIEIGHITEAGDVVNINRL
jgi:hypothetical protein